MEMTNEEILARFNRAEDGRKQITILAQLNGCSEEKIRTVLAEMGVDGRRMPKAKKAPPKGKGQSKAGVLLAVIRDEEKILEGQKKELPVRIAALEAELAAIDGKLDALRKAGELIGEVYG